MARRRFRQDAFSLFSFQDVITSVIGILLLISLLLVVSLSVQSLATTEASELNPSDTDYIGDAQLALTERKLRAEIQELEEEVKRRMYAQGSALGSIDELEKNIREKKAAMEIIVADIEQKKEKLGQLRRNYDSEFGPLVKKRDALIDEVNNLVEAARRPREKTRVRYIFEEGENDSPVLIEIRGGKILIQTLSGTQKPIPYSGAVHFKKALSGVLDDLPDGKYHLLFLVHPSIVHDFDLLWGALVDVAIRKNFSFGYEPLAENDIVIEDISD